MADFLFPHNRKAYDAAVDMLAETGKAAVTHPTGTGKSFIGFQLCLDHPDKHVCWCSPSEYIFRTQLENLAAAGAPVPPNITFLSYARLMLMGESEIAELCPDYIVLDEYHRCGAEHWGQGVRNLLSAFPATPVLGLSATNIRYLDNQRDMADELFDGNVASEMTLGEAIALGILNPPRYVLSVYSYQNELEEYAKRIRRAKSKAVRDEANEYFEALRRAIEKADGLDVIFSRHMTEKHGKYLVFCSGVEHMDEMIGKVPEWFGGVDEKPHIYRAYADDPGTDRAFAAFKSDKSDHLKLLFCVDMLNEGVHVDDVDGVILLRPTISPIIYKQQIGRALAVGKNKDAVIFDVVNNIENLYAIGAVQQEIRLAVTYYRCLGEGAEIVNDGFHIDDEVGDIRKLFERLNDTLSASWERMYSFAAAYYQQNGNLDVPRRYKTPEGYSLGQWIFTQRKVYSGEQYGNLDEDRIRKLEEIGMVWDSVRDQAWNRCYAEAEAYYREHGDLCVPVDYVTKSGVNLGTWLSNQRSYRKSCIRTTSLTPERMEALDRIGMIWSVPDYLWAQNYALAAQYHREHGNLQVPNTYVAKNGVRLGYWIGAMRCAYNGAQNGYRLSAEQIKLLDELGMVWNPHEERWDKGYEHAQAYWKQYADLRVSATYRSEDGFALGTWLDRQRSGRKSGKLSPERAAKLNALGMIWEKEDPWERRYALAKTFFKENGNLYVPAKQKFEGIWLAKWLDEQRQIFCGKRPGKKLSTEQIRRLEEIGMEWENRALLNRKNAWDELYADAERFYQERGHLNVPRGYSGMCGKRLDLWLKRQREAKRRGDLPEEQQKLLNAIGMKWFDYQSESPRTTQRVQPGTMNI